MALPLPALLTALLPLLQVVATVDEGLALLAQGQEVREVAASAGKEAAERLAALPEAPRDVAQLALLARLGGAEPELCAALARILAAARGAPVEAALAELALLPVAEVERATAALGDEALARLLEAASAPDERTVLGALVVLAPALDPAAAADLLEGWGPRPDRAPRARRLLEELPRSRRPAELLAALLELSPPAGLGGPLEVTLLELVRRSPAAADRALAAVEEGQAPAAAVRALGGVALSDEVRLARADGLLAPLLAGRPEGEGGLEPQLVAAALLAAGDLLLPSLAVTVPLHARHPDPTVRAAAAWALGRVGYRDRPTIDLLLLLLEDPAPGVRAAAYEALLRKSGARLPARLDMWRRWREEAALPAGPPGPAAERLAGERQLRANAEARRAARGRRPLRELLPPAPRGAVPTSAAALPPSTAQAAPTTSRSAARAAPPPATSAPPPRAEAPPERGRRELLAIAASLAGLLVLLLLLSGPPAERRVLMRERARAGDPRPSPRPTPAPLELAEDDGVVAVRLQGGVGAGVALPAVAAGGLWLEGSMQTPALAAPAAALPAFEVVLDALAGLGEALTAVSARLTNGPVERRSFFGGGAGGSLEAALGALRGLGALVADVSVSLRGAGLEFVVYEASPSPASAQEDVDPSWLRLMTLVAHGADGFEDLEVRTGSVWRSIHDGPDASGAATLARLGALGPAAVEEVRAKVRGGPRITLLERSGAPRRGTDSGWTELLERLGRQGDEVLAIDVDERGGPRCVYEATDAQRFGAAREALRSGALAGSFAAVLHGSGFEVPLPDDPAVRDSVLDDLGGGAVARLVARGAEDAPLYAADDAVRRARALEALVFGGPERYRAVRARLRSGEPLVFDRGVTPQATPRPELHRPVDGGLAVELPAAVEAPGAEADALLQAVLRALGGVAEALTAVSARLTTDPVARRLDRPGEPPGAALAAAAALLPLLEELTVRLEGSTFDFVVFQRAVPARRAEEVFRLEGLEGALAAFEVVEVRELGRLWRTIQDAETGPADAVAALGALSSEAIQEIRARTRSGTRTTLFRREGKGPADDASGWAAMLGELHRLAPTLARLEVSLQGKPPRTLFQGQDAERFVAAREALRARAGTLSLRAVLRGTEVTLPVVGTAEEVDAALLELGTGTIATLLLEEAGATVTVYDGQDGPRFSAALEELIERRADVVEVRGQQAGEVEARRLYPR